MSIERVTKNVLQKENSPFTTILNEALQGITHTGALGVYCYLASKPTGWIICKKELAKHFNCGREHIDTCFKKLKEFGAIEIDPIRDELGKIVGWNTCLKITLSRKRETRILDKRVKNNAVQNTGFPESGKSAPIKERVLQKKDIYKGRGPKPGVSIDFEYKETIFDNSYKKEKTCMELLDEDTNYKKLQDDRLSQIVYDQKIINVVQECMVDEECKVVYRGKFPEGEIKFERLLEECRSHYVSNDKLFDKYKFIRWITNFRIASPRKAIAKPKIDFESTDWAKDFKLNGIGI